MNLQHIPFKRTLKVARSYLLSFKNAQAWKRNQFIPKSCKHKKLKIDLLFDPRGETSTTVKAGFLVIHFFQAHERASRKLRTLICV